MVCAIKGAALTRHRLGPDCMDATKPTISRGLFGAERLETDNQGKKTGSGLIGRWTAKGGALLTTSQRSPWQARK